MCTQLNVLRTCGYPYITFILNEHACPVELARERTVREYFLRADSRFAPSQRETALLSNDVSHWLVANLESATFLSYDYVPVGPSGD